MKFNYMYLLIIPVMCIILSCSEKLKGISEIYNLEGKKIGTVELEETGDGVRLNINLFNLPPGEHGFHIHESGSFTVPDFNSAKGHFNPFSKEHGRDNPKGQHGGDLPNIAVNSKGEFKGVMVAKEVTLKKGKINSLFKEGGTSFIIHEGPDDMKSNPAGNAGGRIAGGIITEMK